MRIKTYFVLLTLLLTLLGVLLMLGVGGMRPLHLYVIEGLLIGLLAFLLAFYRKIVKPMESVSYGMELLREQDFSSRLRRVGQYEADRIVELFNRMMEQLKTERLHLREQNHFLDQLIKASPMGVVIVSLGGEVTALNPMAVQLLGVSPDRATGKSLAELGVPLAGELDAIPRGGSAVVRMSDANVYRCIHSTFVDQGFPRSFYLIEQMTEEVARMERLAYEKVIRMIAHEVNNSTAGIISTLDSVEQTLAEMPGTADLCEVMRVSAERCYSLSGFITRFADVVKIPAPVLAPVELNELVASCVRFMEGMCRDAGIRLQMACDAQAGTYLLDAALVEQVLVNILKNAVESIRQKGAGYAGEIRVVTQPSGTLEVVDNGMGISREVEAKLFTPFFSTKRGGQGIGLIFIREVLRRHGCSFFLRTGDDGLTRFRITFLK
ncbi:MAG: PAS domain-containing protein [Prevotellaceae bacterium]|jgi:nitrogen fixation/metabolism regulation signal transduction histidine kinase|nr:PAS domain-containing protein [Prevotellaceae bacterium]